MRLKVKKENQKHKKGKNISLKVEKENLNQKVKKENLNQKLKK